MRDYRNLDIWKRAHGLVLSVYRHTDGFPSDERFGLTAQMRRAAISIPTNIAEGAGRATRPDYARFLSMAGGSLNELECHLEIAAGLGFGDGVESRRLQTEVAEIRAMVTAFSPRVQGPSDDIDPPPDADLDA